jgi:hypothetical protein
MGTNDVVLANADQLAGDAGTTLETLLQKRFEGITIEFGLGVEYVTAGFDDGRGALAPTGVDEIGEDLPGTRV